MRCDGSANGRQARRNWKSIGDGCNSAVAIFSAAGAGYYARVRRDNRDEVNALLVQRR